MKKVFLTLMTFLAAASVMAQDTTGSTIELEITNIESDDGKMMIGLYDSEENWLNKARMAKVAPIDNGTCKATFSNVPDGIYAISSYHDENDNNELDTNFLGIPKEDTGASNNAPIRMGPPQWEDAKFEVKGATVRQRITL